MNRIWHFWLLPALAFFGCKEETGLDPDFKQDYFPLEVGRSWIYQIDSIVYDPSASGTVVDTTSGFLKETVVDTLHDLEGNSGFIIERAYRPTELQPWKVQLRWVAYLEPGRAVRQEQNIKLIPLIFPPSKGKKWNGNAFADINTIIEVKGETLVFFKDWAEYRILEEGTSASIAGQSYEKVVTVNFVDNENLIERRYFQEQYARGVGMVAREMEILDTQLIDPNLSWGEKAEKGYRIRQLLLEYK